MLDLYAYLHTDAGASGQHKTKLQIHLAVFETFVRSDKRFGEFVAHIARYRYGPGHPQAHHARSQNEGAARTDEPAHQTADKADQKKENHSKSN